ncbi:flippase [Shewanella frigidimarina]|uniref:flippase n=1 Tax=Shewanella frigidimarina TaxID=56812 RepID=UPI003D7BDC58
MKRMAFFQSKVFTNASWLLAEKILLTGSGLLFLVLLTRHWSVEQVGDYQFLLALLALLSPFSSMGLNSIVSRELVLTPHQTPAILGTALVIRCCGAAVAMLLSALLAFWLVPNGLFYIFLLLLLAQLSHSFYVIDYYFEAHVKSKVSALLRTSIGIVMLLIKLIMVINGSGITGVLIVTAIEWCLFAVAWVGVYCFFYNSKPAFAWSTLQAKLFLSRGWWLILSGVASIIYLKIDQVMLGWMQGSEAVAYYSLASRLSEVWYLFPGVIVASLYPSLIKAKQLDDVYRVKLQRICNLLCWMAISIALVMTFIAPVLVEQLFGVEYGPTVLILQIHVWAGVFIFMRALFSKWILIEDIPKYSLLTHGGGAIVNVILNFWLIPIMGGEGAAWATLISYMAASYLVLFLCKPTREMAMIMSISLIAPILLIINKVNKPLTK